MSRYAKYSALLSTICFFAASTASVFSQENDVGPSMAETRKFLLDILNQYTYHEGPNGNGGFGSEYAIEDCSVVIKRGNLVFDRDGTKLYNVYTINMKDVDWKKIDSKRWNYELYVYDGLKKASDSEFYEYKSASKNDTRRDRMVSSIDINLDAPPKIVSQLANAFVHFAKLCGSVPPVKNPFDD